MACIFMTGFCRQEEDEEGEGGGEKTGGGTTGQTAYN